MKIIELRFIEMQNLLQARLISKNENNLNQIKWKIIVDKDLVAFSDVIVDKIKAKSKAKFVSYYWSNGIDDTLLLSITINWNSIDVPSGSEVIDEIVGLIKDELKNNEVLIWVLNYNLEVTENFNITGKNNINFFVSKIQIKTHKY